jgi:hypothetical protein
MILRIHRGVYLSLLAALFFFACLDDFNREQDPMYYTPSFSIPIGPLNYTLEDIMPPEALGIQVPDTSLTGDSIPLIIYDDILFFENPDSGFDNLLTGPMNLSAISPNMVYATSLMFRMNYANEIPTDLTVQFYFYAGDQLVDSLFPDGRFPIAKAEQGQDGITTIPVTGREEVYIDSSRIGAMMQVTDFELAIHLETYTEDSDILHIYSFYEFNVQLALRAGLLVPFE